MYVCVGAEHNTQQGYQHPMHAGMYVCMHACMHAINVCICMHVCMYVCMHACMQFMYVCIYACMHVRMCVCMYVCMHACMHACMHEGGWNTTQQGHRVMGVRLWPRGHPCPLRLQFVRVCVSSHVCRAQCVRVQARDAFYRMPSGVCMPKRSMPVPSPSL